MNPIDPKWLELLKASTWQTFAIAVACGIFYVLTHTGTLPSAPEWITLVVAFAGLVCGMLAFTGVLSSAFKFFGVRYRFVQFWRRRAQCKDLREYIPHMLTIEKQIIGYLLANNQKMFYNDEDCGNASTLLSRGIVDVALRPNQRYLQSNVPFVVPDHLWEILVESRSEFPQPADPNSPQPWRRHWMNRI
jgi:hypothetical protein